MKVCIFGAGNIGLTLMSIISLDTMHDVVLCTNKFVDENKFVFFDKEKKIEYHHLTFFVEHNIKKALENCDYIFCTYPAFLRNNFILEIEPYVKKNMKLGFIPGYGGAEFMSKKLIDKGVIIFGMQRVPFVARQENKEKAQLLSRKKEIYISSIPKKISNKIGSDLEYLLNIPCKVLNEYLAVTLAPSNPLLHLSGLYNVFQNYSKGESFDKQLMFYEQWNDETSKLLFEYDKELQSICKKMKPMDLSEIVSLKEYYDSDTPSKLTKKLKSIEAFKVVKVPLVEEGGQYYPDYNSRMFIEDFPFGIAIIKYFAILTNVDTPTIDKILNFYRKQTGKCYFNEDNSPGKDFSSTGIPRNYGVTTLEDIYSFYR